MNPKLHTARIRDQLCDRFEQDWTASRSLRIESFLACQVAEAGPDTLDELILLEMDLLHAGGQTPVASEYEKRFPDHRNAIRQGLARIQGLDQTAIARTSLAENAGMENAGMENAGMENAGVENAGAENESEPGGLNWSPATRIPSRVGEFEIIRLLGRGAFGVVYKARNQATGEAVALKFPQRKTLGSMQELQQLQNEARTAAHLDHPAIVRSFGLFDCDGFLFTVQQFVEGPTLAQSEPGDSRRAASLVIRIAEGLACAHRHKLIHRDLKPSNIMIDRSGQPLIADFGLAVHESAQRRLRGQRCGSPPYMSPEQVMGLTHQMDGRSDIWSLGVILYELLAGQRPFTGPTAEDVFEEIRTRNEKPLSMVRSNIDHELQRICLKCLAKPIRERYHTATELADDLRNWLKFADRWQTLSYVPLIPRGLRSYEARDAEAYLQLLPGRRDRFGIPDSIQFWKQKLESLKTGSGFAVGAILGPSGSGKSSFVRAGLLPRLDPGLIRSIYVEATADHTEERLRQSLQGISPEIPDDLSLTSLLDGLGNGVWSPDNKRLLVVIDQFEQWLAANPDGGSSPLVQALRHCNGTRLFCILLARDDYWLAHSRLFHWLGMGWSEDLNIQKVDLLEEAAAKNVLFQIGRAFGRLPEQESLLSSAQKRFLDRVVSEISEDGRIICIHLTLFAEMFRNRTWSLAELKKIGGISGVGETYLEEILGEHVLKTPAGDLAGGGRRVLETLLPESDCDLRARSIGKAELRKAAGNLDDAGFARLLDWLDRDLRLVTRTRHDPDRTEEPAAQNGSDPQPYYQLTHDYLVPSVRNWLNRKKRESWQGRAALRLDELATQYDRHRDPRFLPSFSEYARIRLAIPAAVRNKKQKRLLQQASRRHGARIAILAGIASMLVFAFAYNLHQKYRASALAALDKYLDSPSRLVASELGELAPHRDQLEPRLVESLGDRSVIRRLRANIALQHLLGSRPDSVRQLIADYLDLPESRLDRFEFQNLVTGFRNREGPAMNAIHERFAEIADDNDPAFSVSRVRLALATLAMGDSRLLSRLAGQVEDPTEATLLTDAISRLRVDAGTLAEIAEDACDSALYSLLVGLAGMDPRPLPQADRDRWSNNVQNWFQNHPHAGIHQACVYLANTWDIELPELPAEDLPPRDRDWWVVHLVDGINVTFIRVRPGQFLRRENVPDNLGSRELPARFVTIEKEFWMAATESRFTLWRAWLDSPAGASFRKNFYEGSVRGELFVDDANFPLPAFRVSFLECTAMAEWLNSELDNSLDHPGPAHPLRFSVPTTDQWEHACRAGSKTRYFWGDKRVASLLTKYSVFVQYRDKHPIRNIETPCRRAPNRWGFSDITGNVSEMTACPDGQENTAFYRGGDYSYELLCMSGNAWDADQDAYSGNWGLRLALGESGPTGNRVVPDGDSLTEHGSR